MSVDRQRRCLVAIALAALSCGGAARADDSQPDSAFLEYLGSWDDSDEDWLTVAEWPERAADGDAEQDRDERQDDEQES